MLQLHITDLSCTYLAHHELESVIITIIVIIIFINTIIITITDATDSLASCLQDAERNWQFNMFKFAEETNGNHLSVLTFHYIKTSGLCSRFNLNEAKLSRFLCRIERGYLNNPYHSR